MEGIVTPKDIKQMLDKMDQRHAEFVHYLFVNHYIDNGDDYEFRDEWLVDNYIEEYLDCFKFGGFKPLNSYVVKVLKDWYRDSYSKYLDAVDDLVLWINCNVRSFVPSLGKEIEQAYETGIQSGNGDGFYKPFMPIPAKIAKQLQSKDYEGAVSNIYCIFEQFAKVNDEHADWFELTPYEGDANYGTIPDLECFREAITSLYCHIRQLPDLPEDLRNEMDIHLGIFNTRTHFLGDEGFCSDVDDMFCGHHEQVNDYSDLSHCYMWNWYTDRVKEL